MRTPSASSCGRTNSIGEPLGIIDVDHRSAAAVSRCDISGRSGALPPTVIPGSVGCFAPPARLWRGRVRGGPRGPERLAPRRLEARERTGRRQRFGVRLREVAPLDHVGDRPVRTSGRDRLREVLADRPDVGDPQPQRDVVCGVWLGRVSSSGSIFAFQSLALTSTLRTTTPCRRASATSVCGDQKPIGCAFSSDAQKAAG